MHWVERMESGPVLLPRLPLQTHHHPVRMEADGEFISRWPRLLSPRLFPVIDADHSFYLGTSDEAYHILLPWLRVVNRPDGRLSAVAKQVLQFAPVDLLADLMQPGNLLAEEPPHAMLEACEALPPNRRNTLLPYIRKAVSYDL